MDTLLFRHRNILVLIAVLFVQLVLLAYHERRPDSDVPLIREWVALIVTPPQRLVAGGIGMVGDVYSNYIDLRGARRDNVGLEERLNAEVIRNHELQAQIDEMKRVQSLAAFQETSPSRFLVARVIGASANDQSRVLILNRGREDGVRRDMAVITGDGIVGKIQRVSEGSSQVLLISDEQSGVGALLEKSRIHGVLRGQNADYCQLKYVLNDEKVEVGELLFTSGEDRVFPKGFPIGRVTSVEAATEFKKITVAPAARLNRLEDVLIVLQGREVALPGPLALQAATVPEKAPAATDTNQPKAADQASDRPGIPHGARPETDADKIHELFRQKAAQTNPVKPAAAPGTAATTTAAVQKPATTAAVQKPATQTPGATSATGSAATPAVVKKPAVLQQPTGATGTTGTPAKKPPVQPPTAPPQTRDPR